MNLKAREKKTCQKCGKTRVVNRFRTLSNGSATYKSNYCFACEESPFAASSTLRRNINKPHRGPVVDRYFEDGMEVVVLPPSIGWDLDCLENGPALPKIKLDDIDVVISNREGN